MGKYYAKEIKSKYFDYEAYFDGYEAEADKMWIGGNRNLITINADLYNNIENALEHIYYEIDEAEDDTDRRKTVEYYLKPIERTDAFTDLEISKIIKCAEEYDTSGNDNEVTVASALSIVYGKEFTTGTFRGCCQRDWLNYICPKEIADNRKYMDYVEAVLFATGTEFAITDEKIENADEFESVDVSAYYTAEWGDSRVKEDLAEQIGCSIDEIVILKVIGEHHYVKYEYEEI
mgnify:CR=1 FL=1